jgi:hypothetical protein
VFFCSNRYSNHGGGRTFPVYWDDIAPRCSIHPQALLAFLRAFATGGRPLPARKKSKLPLSVSSAYRWARRWTLNTTHIRTALTRI